MGNEDSGALLRWWVVASCPFTWTGKVQGDVLWGVGTDIDCEDL